MRPCLSAYRLPDLLSPHYPAQVLGQVTRAYHLQSASERGREIDRITNRESESESECKSERARARVSERQKERVGESARACARETQESWWGEESGEVERPGGGDRFDDVSPLAT